MLALCVPSAGSRRLSSSEHHLNPSAAQLTILSLILPNDSAPIESSLPFECRIRKVCLVVVWFLTAGGPPTHWRITSQTKRNTEAMLWSETIAAYEKQRQPEHRDRLNVKGVLFCSTPWSLVSIAAALMTASRCDLVRAFIAL